MGNSTSIISLTSTRHGLTLQTIFTPPPACATGITELGGSTTEPWNPELWNNIIVPTPTPAATSCYPSQFWSSAVATTSLPPFAQLICPDTWETYAVNSTYIICCPGGFGLFAPSISYTLRPALSAICTSVIWPDENYDVTSYDQSTVSTTLGMTAGVNGTLVLATPFDGIAATTTLSAMASATTTTSASLASSSDASNPGITTMTFPVTATSSASVLQLQTLP